MSKVPSDFISPRTGVTHSGTKLWSPRPPPLFPSLPAPSLPFLSRGPTSPQPAGGGPWHLAEGGDPLSITPGGRHFALSTRHTPGWDLGRPRLTKGWHQERETDGGLARFACLCAGPETLTRGTLPEPGTQAGRCAWWGGGHPTGAPPDESPHLGSRSPGLAVAFQLGRGCLAAPKTPLQDSNEPSPHFNYPLSK